MSQEFSRLMKGEITHLASPSCRASGASGALCCRPLLNAFAVPGGTQSPSTSGPAGPASTFTRVAAELVLGARADS